MADQPSHIAGGHLVVGPEGCRLIVAAVDLALKAADRDGVNVRGRSQWGAVEWLYAQARIVAGGQAGLVASGNDASVNAEASWSLDLAESEAWWTTSEAARFLGLTRGGVTAAIRRGELPATRHGRAWLVREADVRTARQGGGADGARVHGRVAGGPDRARRGCPGRCPQARRRPAWRTWLTGPWPPAACTRATATAGLSRAVPGAPGARRPSRR